MISMHRFAHPRHGIVDFAIAVAAGSLAVYGIAGFVAGDPSRAGLDLLAWLLFPALVAALYLTLGRTWAKAGLSLRIAPNTRWFALAALLPLALTLGLFLLATALGLIAPEPGATATALSVALASLAGFAAKNVAEEFAFRGYLTGRFAETVLAGLPGHVLTGLIWAGWHIVYWSALQPEGRIAELSGLPVPAFVALGITVLVLQSVLYGELRLVTGSIWAGVLLHTLNNAGLAGLAAAGAVARGSLPAMLVTPVDFGLVYAGAMALVGLAIWRRRAAPGAAQPGSDRPFL